MNFNVFLSGMMLPIVLLLMQVIGVYSGNDEYITLLNYLQSNARSGQFQCYTPSTFSDYSLSYGRSFKIAESDDLDPQYWVIEENKHRYWTDENLNMGVYFCKVMIDADMTTVQATKVNLNPVIYPLNLKNTVTVNVGDDVTMSFNTELNLDGFDWRKNGIVIDKNVTFLTKNFHEVSLVDVGVYEMCGHEDRADRDHAFIKLIVRGCRRHKWGPPECVSNCEFCFNGGVCSDITGSCICAPGFSGLTCEHECGGNSFGWDCENYCTINDVPNFCKHKHFCLPDPYGCSCVTGFKGFNCLTECDSGTYGADCTQMCHCKQGECDQYTGKCNDTEDSSCKPPWTGSNCQRIINTTFLPSNNGQMTETSCIISHRSFTSIEPFVSIMTNEVIFEISSFILKTNITSAITSYTFSVLSDDSSTYRCVISIGNATADGSINSEIYKLPSYNGHILVTSITSSSVTIGWTAWDSNVDEGNGPIIGYHLYYQAINSNSLTTKLFGNGLTGSLTDLMWDTTYTLSISAIRPGVGGEGPIGKHKTNVKTLCGRPNSVKNIEHQMVDSESQTIRVTWTKIDSTETLKCYNTTHYYTVYLTNLDNQGYRERTYNSTDNELVIDAVGMDVDFVIFVTVSNKDFESKPVASVTKDGQPGLNTTVIIGIAVGVIVVILMVSIVILCKRIISKQETNTSTNNLEMNRPNLDDSYHEYIDHQEYVNTSANKGVEPTYDELRKPTTEEVGTRTDEVYYNTDIFKFTD